MIQNWPTNMQVQVVQAPELHDQAEAINTLGKKSAIVRRKCPIIIFETFDHVLTNSVEQAQALSHEITSANRFAMPPAVEQQQTLMLANDADDCVVGFLKTGIKHLFYMVHALSHYLANTSSYPRANVFITNAVLLLPAS